ncbi:hypothetical protein Pryu01_00154 [Paraliobacillus ryukyuensis]|uniref:Flagellar Assembly Protein A N-terminal region domain-containing protein n=1 Tax=Paraliobacillus ryukyuensis TaxID=200904 RepID=A0A366EHC6_9BACI|nr:FapA family protein [Paraliobacillus ryukyuensis]RBP01774.1 hypothetical protein DES48_101518 [Paraliobacillus ryukyuensis]
MGSLDELFRLEIAKDKMSATLHSKKVEAEEIEVSDTLLTDFLAYNNVVYGIDNEALLKVASENPDDICPIMIAKGVEPIHGVDGRIDYVCEQKETLNQEEKRDFRDIKKIPSLRQGEKIAIITQPTEGKPGRNIYDQQLKAKPGKQVRIKPGKNVVFKDEDLSFYAAIDGQLSIKHRSINVFNTYEVSGDLSLETGNLNFVGSIVIKGNVPSGYRVEAEGDIHVHGLVEGAYLEAKGNIVITEGIAGLRKGTLIAGGNITIGYANQAIIDAGEDLYVQQSILQSYCTSRGSVYCETGHIIGGSCSAGKSIEVKDIGNQMDTKTEIAIGINQRDYDLENQLTKEKESLVENIKKLENLGSMLKQKKDTQEGLTAKERVILLKQRNSMVQTKQQLASVTAQLEELKVEVSDATELRLIAKGTVHPNTILHFGKYEKTIAVPQKFTQVYLKDGEIITTTL